MFNYFRSYLPNFRFIRSNFILDYTSGDLSYQKKNQVCEFNFPACFFFSNPKYNVSDCTSVDLHKGQTRPVTFYFMYIDISYFSACRYQGYQKEKHETVQQNELLQPITDTEC